MIDIENKIFTAVSTILRSTYPGIMVYGEYVEAPASFPTVSISEDDNFVPSRYKSLDRNDDTYADVMYTVNVYSNLSNGKKTQAKTIISSIDSVLSELGFIRSFLSPVPNLDRTIYRMTARYMGRVHKVEDTVVIHSK